jgi:transposase
LVHLYSQEREARVAAEAEAAELRVEVGRLREGCGRWDEEREARRVAEAEVAALKEQLAQAERAAHVQAAPFRRPTEKRKATPGKPGRPTGHAPAYRRSPEPVDEEVQVPLTQCPDCGGALEDVRPVTQVIEDLEVRVRRVRVRTHTGRCLRCGVVRSTHPAQVSTAQGAAGTQIGAQALGLAAYLNKDLKLTVRKSCAVLKQLGLSLSPGGMTQALARVSGRLAEPFEQLQRELRASPAVHADETGWWLAGRGAWLWDFTTPHLTLYTIDNRSQEVIRRVLGDDYCGVLISDCLPSYDPHPGRKSQCVAHHLKAIGKALERTPTSFYLREIRLFWQTALALHAQRPAVEPIDYAARRAHLERWLERLLVEAGEDPDEQRIANRLRKQRPHLLTFLYHPAVDPTNNLAERQLRPAVIARKLSAGNKTDRGRQTFEILASLAATCHQRGADFADLVAQAATLPTPTPALPQPP